MDPNDATTAAEQHDPSPEAAPTEQTPSEPPQVGLESETENPALESGEPGDPVIAPEGAVPLASVQVESETLADYAAWDEFRIVRVFDGGGWTVERLEACAVWRDDELARLMVKADDLERGGRLRRQALAEAIGQLLTHM